MRQQTAAGPSDEGDTPRAPVLLIEREASDQVVAIGLRSGWVADLYDHALSLPWVAFLGSLSLVYLGLNLLFAFFYLLGDEAIAEREAWSIFGRFLFQRRDVVNDRLRTDVAGNAL